VIRKLVPSRGYAWLLLVAIALAALFVRLGFWQLHRLHERQAFKASVLRAEREPPRPLDSLGRLHLSADSLAYHRATATGFYLRHDEVVLYGRALRGRPGNQLLTPLITRTGRAIIVNRGWVPSGMDRPPVSAAAPPHGAVTVTGLLFPPEESTTGSGRVRVLTRIDITRIREGLSYPLYPVYLQVQRQVPPRAGRLPVVLPPPDLNAGPPNLSYAIQWFSFAAIALVGYFILALRRGEDASRNGEDASRNEPLVRPGPDRASRRPPS
jgi:cytochrome oxidase assembly protein ShyY1